MMRTKYKATIISILFSILCSLLMLTTACGGGEGTPAAAVGIGLEGYKEEFLLGEEFSTGELRVTASYEDGSERLLDAGEYTVVSKEFRSLSPQKVVITVTMNDTEITAAYEVRVVRSKESLKILAIGNSFSEDSLSNLYEMAEEAGAKDIVLGNMYIGGCSLARHAENMKNDSAVYQYQKNTDGKWVKHDGKSLLYGLGDEEWDIVTLQQASGDSGVMETYNNDLTNLLQFVYANKPKPQTNIVWHMTWAYQGDSTHNDFGKYGHNQTTMYNAIVDCVHAKIVGNKLVQTVIPTGTAIQNLRSTDIGDTVTRDGYHLSYTIGRYTAGMTWLTALTGWDISELTCDYFDIGGAQLQAVKESVVKAIVEPFAVS